MRGRNRTKGPNPLTRTYESNGPDVKIRGTAQHVADKYAQLARDAQASGDPVSAENYFQHAEHYYRMIAAAQEQFKQQYGGQRFDEDGEEGDEDGFGGPPGSGQGLGDDYGDGQGYAPQQNFEPRAPVERPQAPQQRFDRNDRPQQNNRQQRFDRGGERYDRGQDRNAGDRNQGDRNDRFERPAAGGGERFDRPVNGGGERFDRPNNGERYDRQDKRDRFPRDGAPRDGQAPREFQPRDGQPPRENGRDPRQDRDARQDREPRPEREARPEREPRPERTPYRAEPRFEDREAEAELPAANLPAFLTNPVRPTIAVETAAEDSTHRESVPAAGETEPVETGIRPRRRRTRKVEGTDTVGLDLTGEATETPAE